LVFLFDCNWVEKASPFLFTRRPARPVQRIWLLWPRRPIAAWHPWPAVSVCLLCFFCLVVATFCW
jgi:hypothetical protein